MLWRVPDAVQRLLAMLRRAGTHELDCDLHHGPDFVHLHRAGKAAYLD